MATQRRTALVDSTLGKRHWMPNGHGLMGDVVCVAGQFARLTRRLESGETLFLVVMINTQD